MTQEKWTLSRFYGYKNKINRKQTGEREHLLADPKNILFCGLDKYNLGRVEYHNCHQLTVKKSTKDGRSFTSYKDVIEEDGSTSTVRAAAGDSRVSYPKDKYFFDCIVFDLFKRVQQKKNGVPQVWKRGARQGEPMYDWFLVTNEKERRNLLKDLQTHVDSGDVRTHKKMYMMVGTGHFKSLLAVSLACRNKCECGGKLTTMTYVCENCGEITHDIGEWDGTRKQFAEKELDPNVRCSNCGHVGPTLPLKDCDSCDDPRPLGLDKIVCKLELTGEGTSSSYVLTGMVPVTDFVDDAGNLIVEIDDQGDPMVVGDRPIFVEDVAESYDAVWDFESMITHPDHEISEFLGLRKGDPGYTEPPERTNTKSSRPKRTF